MLQSKLVVPCVWRETRSERLHGDQLEKRTVAVVQILNHLWQKINPALGAPRKLLSVKDWAPERFLSRGGSNEDLF